MKQIVVTENLAIQALNDAMKEHHFVPEMIDVFRKSYKFYFDKRVKEALSERNKKIKI